MSGAMLKKKRTVFNPESSPMMDADSIDDQLSLRNSVFCMKVSYSFYNVILMLFGVLAIGVGVWSFFTFFRINLLLCSNYYSVVCLMLIISGMLVLFFLFVIGCYGSFHDSYPCWNFFSFGLMFVFLINLAISCSVIKYKLMISKDLLKFMEHNMNSYKSKYVGIKNAFDAMHRKFRCCGINSFSDWFSLDTFLNTTSVVPDSCCISESVNCGGRNHPSNIYYEGCSKFLDSSLQQQLAIIALTSSILCCIQLSGVVLSCCLVKKRKGIHIIHH